MPLRAPRALVLALALALASAPLPSAGRAEDGAVATLGTTTGALSCGRRPVAVRGFVSTSWQHNFDRPASGTNRYRAFDVRDRRLQVDVAQLSVERPVQDGRTGFRLDLAAGTALPRVMAARGLFRDPDTGEAEDFDVQQAFVSRTWDSSRWRLDLGKFLAPLGYELTEGCDGWNDHASHSLTYILAEPSTLTGLKLSRAFTPRWSGTLLLVQGWDVFEDNNSRPTVGVQAGFAPDRRLSCSLTYLTGPEKEHEREDRREATDLVVTWKPSVRWTLGLNHDWGQEENAALGGGVGGGGGLASWDGVALYAARRFGPRFALGLRRDWFDDRDGARTGTPQVLRALTLTPSWTVARDVVVRLDLRRDWSSEPTFEHGAGPGTNQTTVLVNALARF